MRDKRHTPKALRQANAKLEERKERIGQITQALQKPKRKGLLARLFGWMR